MRILLLVVVFICGCAAAPPQQQQKSAAPTELVFPPAPEEARFIFERVVVSSADVVVADRETRWRQILTGEKQSGIGLAKPFDVTACRGRVYVSDTVRRVVFLFDIPNSNFIQIGLEDPGALRKPLGMDNDAACNLYVADASMKRVTVYDENGNFLRAVGGSDYFERLSHVAVDPAGKRIFAVDTGGVDSDSHRVRVFDAISGEHLYDIGSRGTEPGQFNLPRDIEFGPDGMLYVVDGGNFRVEVFKTDGTFVRSIGAIGTRFGQFARPKGVALDPAGNIYVSDASHGNVQIFSSTGELLMFMGERSETFGRAKYMLPAGVEVDEDGRVLMVDQFFRKLDIYRPAGLAELAGFLGPWNAP